MSGTDKTRPWSVKTLDRPTWLAAEHHHEDGACDLPPRPTKQAAPFGDRATRCTWVATREFWSAPHNRCGCPGCTGQVQRHADRRRDRHAASESTRVGAALAALPDADPTTEPTDEPFDGSDAFTDAAGLVADALDLPETSLVVDLRARGGRFHAANDCGCGDCGGCVAYETGPASERVEHLVAEILHNDGTRETRRLDATVLAGLIDQAADDFRGHLLDSGLVPA